jgi:hypothetical protein
MHLGHIKTTKPLKSALSCEIHQICNLAFRIIIA